MYFINKIVKTYFYIVIILLGLLNASQKNAYNDKLLFCLKKTTPPLTITQADNHISTKIEILDKLIKYNNIYKLEKWLPGATENDFDGDIFLNRIYRIYFPNKSDEELSLLKEMLESIKEIHSCEFEFKRKPLYTPNDPYYNNQWFLPAIHSDDVWNFWTDEGEIPGDRQVILASVDTGVNWSHVDLRNNLWENLGEDADGDGRTIEGSGNNWYLDPGDLNGIDDDDWDNNSLTFIDDLIGWDPSGLGGLDDNNPDPPNSGGWAHGTHVAGLLSASTDNSTGISSTAFNCSIMSVKVSDENQGNDIYITDGFAGILYAAKAGYYAEGFSVINNSWGGGGFSLYENSVINECVNDYNAIIVCAGGNGSTTGWGEAYEPHYPSSYENSIAVCPLGSNNSWNHWGTYHESIDLASPGENIRSCTTPNNYSSWDGSSMASPVAASVFGLLKSYNMDWTNEMVQTMVLATADPIIYEINTENYLQGMLGNGRVDAYKALSTSLFPKIEYVGEDIVILNDFDGDINPGDQIQLSTILLNHADWGHATDASIELINENLNITIENSYMNIGDILSGDIAINIDTPFIINFNSNLTDLTIELNLKFISNIDGYIKYETSFPIFLELIENSNMSGDLNQDSILNILDVVQLVNIILGVNNPSNLQLEIGDLNEDGLLNIQDIIILLSLILS